MSIQLIYWFHTKHIWSVEGYMQIYWNLERSKAEEEVNKLNELARKPQIYTEENFEALKDRPSIKECYRFTLGKHSLDEPIPTFRGFTPKFSFQDEGFKDEGKIDLLKHIDYVEEVQDGLFKGARRVKNERWADARISTGRENSLEIHRQRLAEIYNRLKDEKTDFVAFRDYRNFPATWDIVHFFSRGNFRIQYHE